MTPALTVLPNGTFPYLLSGMKPQPQTSGIPPAASREFPRILEHPDFVAGNIDTGFLTRAGPIIPADRSTDVPPILTA